MTTMPTRNVAPPPPAKAAKAPVKFGKPVQGMGHRVLLYAPGGWGKTTLAFGAPGPVVFFDLDESLGKLGLEAQTVNDIGTWSALRATLQGDGWSGVKTIVIDSATKAEEMAIAHTLLTVKMEKGGTATSIEDYGYGRGFGHAFDTFMGLLVDLDKHVREGRNVILIAHDCVNMVPHPAGEDFQRYEPRLQSPASGKNSIRLRVREWSDHTLFGGYDVEVKNKKGKGYGTRTLYPSELPSCMAKSRSWSQPIPVGKDAGEVWSKFIKQEG